MCISPRTGSPAEDGGSNSDGHREASLELLKRVQAFFCPLLVSQITWDVELSSPNHSSVTWRG